MSVVLATAEQNGVLLEVRHGDICSEQVSAIVNPANEAMRHRGGVAKVIADKAGGGIVQRESDEWISRHGPLTTGERVAVTSAGALPCTYVVHVAGPVHKAACNVSGCTRVTWNGMAGQQCCRSCLSSGGARHGPECERVVQAHGSAGAVLERNGNLLRSAVLLALGKAEEVQCTAIALPAISSGIFGFPLDRCAQILVECGREFAGRSPRFLRRIAFTNIDQQTAGAFRDALEAAVAAAAAAAAAAAGAAFAGPPPAAAAPAAAPARAQRPWPCAMPAAPAAATTQASEEATAFAIIKDTSTPRVLVVRGRASWISTDGTREEMRTATSEQVAMTKQLSAALSCSQELAFRCLQRAKWNYERASNEYYNLDKQRWKLPGGSFYRHETPFQAACRLLEEQSGYDQERVQLTCTGGADGPHPGSNNATFFLKEFDFGALGQARYQIFQDRPILSENSFGDVVLYDTYDYGFAALLPGGQIEVQEYNGTAKEEQDLKGGNFTGDPLREAFSRMTQ